MSFQQPSTPLLASCGLPHRPIQGIHRTLLWMLTCRLLLRKRVCSDPQSPVLHLQRYLCMKHPHTPLLRWHRFLQIRYMLDVFVHHQL